MHRKNLVAKEMTWLGYGLKRQDEMIPRMSRRKPKHVPLSGDRSQMKQETKEKHGMNTSCFFTLPLNAEEIFFLFFTE